VLSRSYDSRLRRARDGDSQAVWSHDTTVTMAAEPFSDGREWTRPRPAVWDGVTVGAYPLPSIFAQVGIRSPSIVKLDIEGAETVLFRDDPETWLSHVDSVRSRSPGGVALGRTYTCCAAATVISVPPRPFGGVSLAGANPVAARITRCPSGSGSCGSPEGFCAEPNAPADTSQMSLRTSVSGSALAR
jgi:hypothetical protein